MNKLTTKNWMRVRINNSAKTITFTNDTTYKTESECLVDIKSNQYIAINKRRFNKMISEGWIEMFTVSKETAQICDDAMILVDNKEEWQPQFLVGGSIEQEIAAYTVAKLKRQGVQFIKGASTKESIPLWEQSTIDHSVYQKKLESDKAESMKASFNVDNDKYYKKRERELNKVNDELLMDVYETINSVGIVQ